MSSAPLPLEKQTEIEDLAQAIREAIETEIGELAANLATTDDAHIFGDNEFKIRPWRRRSPRRRLTRWRKKNGYEGASVTCPHCDQAAEFHSHRTHSPLSLVGSVGYEHACYCPALQPGDIPLR